jgi:hypothetical protein
VAGQLDRRVRIFGHTLVGGAMAPSGAHAVAMAAPKEAVSSGSRAAPPPRPPSCLDKLEKTWGGRHATVDPNKCAIFSRVPKTVMSQDAGPNLA